MAASNSVKSAVAADTQTLSDMIQSRKNNFRRRAPAFSRTLRTSSFSYPATSRVRRNNSLNDIQEIDEKDFDLDDLELQPIESMNNFQVCLFIKSLGVEYEKYENKFLNINGLKLMKLNDKKLKKMYKILPKLHRKKILLQISSRRTQNNNNNNNNCWSVNEVCQWCLTDNITSIYVSQFMHHGVDGMLLINLDKNDLITIGIQNKIHQKHILLNIEKLSNNNFNVQNVQNVQNHDLILDNMSELLLEISDMFKINKIQKLRKQLIELRKNCSNVSDMRE